MKVSAILFTLLGGALGVAAADSPKPFLNTNKCPQDYKLLNNYCFHKDSEFSVETQNALTTVYDSNQKPINAHYVTFTVFGTIPGTSQKVAIPQIPLEIVPAEADQLVLSLKPENGEISESKIKAYSRFAFKTNNEGRVGISFAINKDSDLRLQKLLFRSSFMDLNDWKFFRGDTAAVAALSKLKAEDLLKINPDMDAKLAKDTARSIATLVTIAEEDRGRKYSNVESGALGMADANMDDLSASLEESKSENKEWEKIEKEQIKDIKVVSSRDDSGKGIVKTIIQTGKRVIEFIVKSFNAVVKVLASFLRLVGLTILKVVDGIKTVIRWDEVLNTQVALNSFLLYVKENTPGLLNQNREKALQVIKSLDGPIQKQLETLIGIVKGKPEFNESAVPEGVQSSNRAEYAFVVDAVVSNGDKTEIIAPAGSLEEIEKYVSELEPHVNEMPAENKEVRQQLQTVKKELGLKKVGKALITGVLRLVQIIMSALNSVAYVSTDLVLRLFQASAQLFWFVTTFEVKVPVISPLYKALISNGRYELSLMSLATLVPAIVYTYGYMLTHYGKGPFPEAANGAYSNPTHPRNVGQRHAHQVANVRKPTDVAVLEKRSLTRRLLGGLIASFVALLILIIIFDLMLTLFVGLIHLAWTLPVSTLILIIFLLVILG